MDESLPTRGWRLCGSKAMTIELLLRTGVKSNYLSAHKSFIFVRSPFSLIHSHLRPLRFKSKLQDT